MDGQQLLRDANISPTSEVIANGLGLANNVYTHFLFLLEEHSIELNWRYYNDGKAWLAKGLYKWSTTRGTPKETTAFWLSVWDGFFKVVIYIPDKYRADALKLPLDDKVMKMVKEADQIGKLKFFPLVFDLCSTELFNEIFTLVDFRKMLK